MFAPLSVTKTVSQRQPQNSTELPLATRLYCRQCDASLHQIPLWQERGQQDSNHQLYSAKLL